MNENASQDIPAKASVEEQRPLYDELLALEGKVDAVAGALQDLRESITALQRRVERTQVTESAEEAPIASTD